MLFHESYPRPLTRPGPRCILLVWASRSARPTRVSVMDFETAIEYARVMAARGQRVWRVREVPKVRPGWSAWPGDDDWPWFAEAPPSEIRPDLWVVYPSGLVVPATCVPWVWWFAEERKYRLGNAEQVSIYCGRRPQSCVAVPPEYLHGCQVREDGGPELYRFVTAVSFPHWCGV